jgi:hypothetical protein
MHGDAHSKLKGLIPAFLGLLMVLVACKSDPCEDISCVHGDCQEGVCSCAAYYEGESCDTESRAKFLGTNWYNNRICPSGSQFLVTTIQAGLTNAGQVMLTNIHQDPDTIAGQVNGDTLVIPTQAYGFEYIEGTGFYSDGSITLEYKVIQTAGGETECIAHLTR